MIIDFRTRVRQQRHGSIMRACDNAFLFGFTAGATFVIILHGLTAGSPHNPGEGSAKVLPFKPRAIAMGSFVGRTLAALTDSGIPWAIATSGRAESAYGTIETLGIDPVLNRRREFGLSPPRGGRCAMSVYVFSHDEARINEIAALIAVRDGGRPVDGTDRIAADLFLEFKDDTISAQRRLMDGVIDEMLTFNSLPVAARASAVLEWLAEIKMSAERVRFKACGRTKEPRSNRGAR